MYDYEKERREAIDAGERALACLKNAARELNSAGHWGMLDIFGGGFISSMMKRGKMENAGKYMEQAKYNLFSFSKELRDIGNSVDLHIDTEGFLSFADWFFDGFAVDMVVQSQIKHAKEQVNEAIYQVELVLSDLKD